MANAQQLPLAVRRALENHFYDTYPDPGSGGTISIGEVGIGICRVTTAGAESRALPAASGYPIGQRLVVILETDGGDLTITGAEDGSVSLDDAGDFAEFIVTQGVSGSTVTRYWRTTLSTTDLGNSVSADSAFGTDDVLVASDGTARKAKATTIDKDDVVTEAAAASGANQVVVSAGATKVVKDSGVAYTNIPTMAANGTSGNLVSSAGNDKTLQDASVAVANVPTMAAAATGADYVITSAAADKTLQDSTIATQAASSFDVDATEWRIHDAIDTGLTDGGAAVDDLGIVDAGFTVGEVAVRGVTGAGLTDTSYARVRVPLPADYVAGENVTVTFYVTENDGAATSSTIDLEATCANDRTADICATGAQSIAGAASTAYAFTITGTTIVASDILDLRMAIANNDGGGGGNGTSHDIERTKVTFTRQI